MSPSGGISSPPQIGCAFSCRLRSRLAKRRSRLAIKQSLLFLLVEQSAGPWGEIAQIVLADGNANESLDAKAERRPHPPNLSIASLGQDHAKNALAILLLNQVHQC